MRRPLTHRRRDVLDFIKSEIAAKGIAPSMDEIGRRFALRSLATVHALLGRLERDGFITRQFNTPRAITINPVDEPCPMCGHRSEGAW